MLAPHHSAPSSPRSPSPLNGVVKRRLRIVASGTLFITHTISMPSTNHQQSFTSGSTTTVNMRAQSVSRSRGGSAANILTILCQFNPPTVRRSPSPNAGAYVQRYPPLPDPTVEAWLVAPIGRGAEANALLNDLERDGVRTKLCARREGEGVPSAYVIRSLGELLHQTDDGAGGNREKNANPKPKPRGKLNRTVINYNPIPDLTHEEFIRVLSPILYPVTTPSTASSLSPPNRSPTSPEARYNVGDEILHVPTLDPPFDWLHFEGRTAQTTLSNMTGLDGFARDRGWRSKMVFSLDCMRAGRPGQDALIPHADVIFFSKSYARAQLYTSPRAFLLAQALRAAPHALLIVSWADQGSALFSVPTKEYFQSSKFVVERDAEGTGEFGEFESVRSSTVIGSNSGSRNGSSGLQSARTMDIPEVRNPLLDDEDEADDDDVIDESGADDAFVAGMIYALSRRVLPNITYSPIQPPQQPPQPNRPANPHLTPPPPVEDDLEKGRWRLEECLRFATEMAGRKVRIKGFNGLARAMENVGWFNDY